MAKTSKAHAHRYDIHPNPAWPTHVACTVCGFAVPASMLTSKHNLDAITARENATPAGLMRIALLEEAAIWAKRRGER